MPTRKTTKPDPEATPVDALVVEAAQPEAPDVPEGSCTARVTKAGHGKIFTGRQRETHNWGDVLTLPIERAQELEGRHYVETDLPIDEEPV
ncbi:MAG: hypothetical protein AAFX52_11150 [Pseudomonadota bacterium]